MNDKKDYFSGITGRAQVRCGGKLSFCFITLKTNPDIAGFCCMELKESLQPGEVISDNVERYDPQLTVLFDSIESINVWRSVLDDCEDYLKERERSKVFEKDSKEGGEQCQ